MASSASAGVSTGAGTKVDVTLKLSQLQNLCKRDPVGYREDYDAQVRRLESECGILKLSPQSPSPRLVELIQFAAAVSSSSYKGEESDRIANLLIDLLVGGQDDGASATKMQMTMPTMALQLHREVRKTCVSALILMRNKGVIPPLRLLELFFRLMAVVADKGLRELLYKHMVNDIRNLNKKGKRDDKVNRSIQSYMHRVVSTHAHTEGGTAAGDDEESATDIAAKRATDLVCELYRRQVWTDERTVAILASACTSKNTTVMARSMRFFLNIEEKMADDAKQVEDDDWDASQKIDFHRFSRKTAARKTQVKRQVKNRQKQQRKREGTDKDEWMDIRDDEGVEASKKLYPAIELLRDPQGLAEAVLRRLKTPKSIPYRIKLLMMNFVTRLVGNHELLLLNLYPFLQNYMGGNQRDVTAVLAYTVQACHENVPPDEVYGILKTIAHNFVTERCSEEQMAVGINSIRAICGRVPPILSLEESRESTGAAAMDVEAFVRDIAAYSNHRDRSVGIAGKSFTNFIREVYPSLLQGKDRGLKGSALHRNKAKPMRFGEHKVSSGVEGADLLVEYESKKAAHDRKQLLEQQDEADGEEQEELEDFEEVEGEMDEEASEGEDEDEEAPELVALEKTATGDQDEKTEDAEDADADVIDLSKMTTEERDALKAKVSSTRVFSAADFVKMRKLVEREEKARRDPREAARRKRAIAKGEEFDALSGDESSDVDSDEEDEIRVKGAVNLGDIMAEATRKRKSKAEKLTKVLAGRDKFETKGRAGGSTNTEKIRKKNFLMTQSSRATKRKGRSKGGLSNPERGGKKKEGKKEQMGHLAKKRRRKL
jgi:protein SDA1